MTEDFMRAGTLATTHTEQKIEDNTDELRYQQKHNSEHSAILYVANRSNLSKRLPSKESSNQVPNKEDLILEWGKVKPLFAAVNKTDYPVELLPDLIREAVIEIHLISKAPIALIASSAIATLGAAVQSHVDVARDAYLIGPTGLYFLTLGQSGERKSAVDKFFMKVFHEYADREKKEAESKIIEYQSDLDIWNITLDRMKNSLKIVSDCPGPIQKQSKDGRGRGTVDGPQLRDHYSKKPAPPTVPNPIVTDVTSEKLLQHLSEEWPSVLLTTPEAALVFGGQAFKKDNIQSMLGQLNCLWSGEKLNYSRKTVKSFQVSGARLTASLMMQTNVFLPFLRDNPIARDIGFFARFLISEPESTQGNRFYREPPENMEALERHQAHLRKILETRPKILNGILSTSTVTLTEKAKRIWIAYHDKVEARIRKGKDLEHFRDFASKSAENASRLAAIFQACKEFPFNEVDEISMRLGCEIAEWHLNEIKRLLASKSHEELVFIRDCEFLENFIVKKCLAKSTILLTKSFVMQGTHIKVARLSDLLQALTLANRVRYSADGKLIEVNPVLLDI